MENALQTVLESLTPEDCLSVVELMQPVRYELNATGNALFGHPSFYPTIGLTTDPLLSSSIPELACDLRPNMPYSDTCYIKVPVVLAGAIQALKAQNQDLQDQIDELEDQIAHAPRLTTHIGVTNGSGNFSVVYPEEIIPSPLVSVSYVDGNPARYTSIVSATTTGFTVRVMHRIAINILGINVPVTLTPSSGVTVHCLAVNPT